MAGLESARMFKPETMIEQQSRKRGCEAMNEHLVKIREICEFLRQVVPICYLRAIQHKLDEIVAEADAIKAILEREGL
jgi:hypothetical protein